MNTLVKNMLAASAFIFAIGAAFTSTSAKIVSSAQGFSLSEGDCIVGTVSASCTLNNPNGMLCSLVQDTNITAIDPAHTNCTDRDFAYRVR